MRDPSRIPRICRQIETLWHYYPDLRLGQLIINFILDKNTRPFYTEDDEIEEKLLRELSKLESGNSPDAK